MRFYDENREPMEIKRVASQGGLFLIAALHESNGKKDLYGLFIEDDENYFLKAKFDPYWLNDLHYTATIAVAVRDTDELHRTS